MIYGKTITFVLWVYGVRYDPRLVNRICACETIGPVKKTCLIDYVTVRDAPTVPKIPVMVIFSSNDVDYQKTKVEVKCIKKKI